MPRRILGRPEQRPPHTELLREVFPVVIWNMLPAADQKNFIFVSKHLHVSGHLAHLRNMSGTSGSSSPITHKEHTSMSEARDQPGRSLSNSDTG